MGNRLKENDKIERTIRGLLKLPENRRCINCNMLGPQYVCTTFFTFVCTNCSGIHREFTHRVKSVSMAKFTAEEVSALQAGGNERARQIFFKEWDPQRHSYPDGSNLHKLRDFMKHVYVDRKYTGERSMDKLTGERSTDKLPRLRLTDKEESRDNRKVGAYFGGFRSPQYEDRYERSPSERSYPGERSDDGTSKYYYDERRSSPRYSQQNSRSGGYKRNPVRFEIVDDRLRDDRFGSGRRHETHRLSKGEFKFDSRSPDRQTNLDRSRSPVVLPVKDTSGENVPNLQISEHSKANNGKDGDGSAHNQNIESSSGVASVDSNTVENEGGNSESLIDLNTNSNPSNAVAAPQTHQVVPSNDGGNQSSNSAKEKAPQAPIMNTLEALLFELSPAIVPVGNTSEVPSSNDAPLTAPAGNMPTGDILSAAPAGQMPEIPNNDSASTTTSTIDVPAQPSTGGPPQAVSDSSENSIVKVPDEQQLPKMQQHQPSASPATDSSSTAQLAISPVGALNNQVPEFTQILKTSMKKPCTSSLLPNEETPFGAFAEQSSQAVSKPALDTSSIAGAQTLPVETKSSGRRELPADIFTASYPSVPATFQGWQTHTPHGMGFSMQYYPNTTPVSAFLNSAKSTNPFDLNNETAQVQATPFPSMTSLHGALPNVSAPAVLFHPPSFGTQSSGWMAPQSPSYASAMHPHSPSFASAMRPQSPSFTSAMHPQSPSFASAMPTGAYMGQQVYMNVPPYRPQGISGFGSDGAMYGYLDATQQSTSRYPAANSPNSYSSKGGNPFG